MSITRRHAMILGATALVASRLPAWAALNDPPASGPLGNADVEALLKKNKVPGAGLAVIDGGAIVAAYGYGLTKVGSTDRVTAATRFQAASLSKMINALVVLKLVEAGKVKLDDPVNDHLKSWKLGGKNAAGATLRALLSHTGGTTVSGFAGYEPGKPVPTLVQVLDGKRPANSKAVTASGRLGVFAYSGGGVTVLQQMVIDVTGETYEAAAKRLVFAPLAMTNSSFSQPPSPAEAATIASAHGKSGRTVAGGFNVYPELAAAGLWSTPYDIALSVLAIMQSVNGGSGAFLSPALVGEMMKPVDKDAALGTFVASRGRFHHNGVNLGYRNNFWASPPLNKAVVGMTNGENGEAVNNVLLPAVYKQYAW